MPNIIETAAQAGNFQTLIKVVKDTGLVEILENPGPYTVFAPTDDAFAKLPKETLDSLLRNTSKLKRIVSYHIAFGDVRSDDLMQIKEADTFEGSVVAIESDHGSYKVNNANILKTDILADNGVIHVIDAVLVPAIVAAEE